MKETPNETPAIEIAGGDLVPALPTGATLDQVLAAVQNVPETIKGSLKWAIQKESRPPGDGELGGAVYHLVSGLFVKGGVADAWFWTSDQVNQRIKDAVYTVLEEAGIIPPKAA